MINVDKAYSVLIKNSNRYWINKHRLGPQAALVCQSVLRWIDMCTLPMSLRLKGVSKKLRDRTLYHRHYNRSNASYLAIEIFHRTQMALGETILWSPWSENPILWFIQSLDSSFIYGLRFKNSTDINQSRADNIPMRSLSHKLVLGIQADLLRKDFLANWMNEMLSHHPPFAPPQLSVRFQTLNFSSRKFYRVCSASDIWI